jgi:hypothetical protein
MGRLKPNTTYIYERVDGVVYAREAGSDPSTRIEIGRDYDPRTSDGRPLIEQVQEDKMWGEIRRMARTNPTLQDAINRVIMIYKLSKEYNNGI